MKPKSIFGFTLIEIVLVVFIIAFLGSLAFVSTKSILNKSKESQKIDDIKTLQTALDLYKANEGFYPATSTIIAGQPLISADGTKTYLKEVPKSASGNSDDAYHYYQLRNGSSYKIDYKLKSKVGDFPPGRCLATLGSVCKTCNPVCTNKCAGELDSCEDQECANPDSSTIISNITATTDESKTLVIVNWTAFSYANTTYKLEYSSSTNGGSTWSPFSTLVAATTTASYDHVGLNSNYQYKYKVTPTVCSSIVGTASAESSIAGCTETTVSAPTGLTLTGVTSGVKISWSTASGATSYVVYGRTNGSKNVIVSTSSLSYYDNYLLDGSTYYYAVGAIACGKIATSSQQSVVVGGPNLCSTPTLTTECTAANNKGDLCGGGYLFCEGEANCGGANLVASLPINSSGNCSNSDNLRLKWRLTSTTVAEPSPYTATSSDIGYLNLNGNTVPTEDNYNPDSMYAAAAFCATSTMSGFTDWYLPSNQEICAIIRSGNYCQSLTSSCTSGAGQTGKTALNGCTNDNPFVGGLGGDSQSCYWTSREAGGSYPGYSVRWRANTGENTLTSKHTTLPKLRCMRRF